MGLEMLKRMRGRWRHDGLPGVWVSGGRIRVPEKQVRRLGVQVVAGQIASVRGLVGGGAP